MGNTPLLEGLHVVDLASFIAGPAAAAVLGDFGADVVKVEPPHVGDAYRSLSRIPPNPHVEGGNYPWQLDNRNKRSIALLDPSTGPSRPMRSGNMYRTADDRWIVLVFANEDKEVPRFLKAIGHPEAAENPRYADTPSRRAHADLGFDAAGIEELRKAEAID